MKLVSENQRECIRVALFTTHPIQYQIPWFKRLSEVPFLDLRVYFGMIPDDRQQGVGFGVEFQWDIPLLEGYRWQQLKSNAFSPIAGKFMGCCTTNFRQIIGDWRPDVALLTGWQSLMLVQAWWTCVRLGIPRIVRGESSQIAYRPVWKRLGHSIWLRGYDRFLAIGKANREFYRTAGIADACIHDCPYFVDNQRFLVTAAELQSQRSTLRKFWGIPEKSICFLFSGKLVQKKKPLDFLRALGQAAQWGARIHGMVVGAGELMEAARALAQQEQLPLSFTGFLNQSEIVRAYVAADCLVLPSDAGETWGLVVNEAMACGLPAIVSDQVGCGQDLVFEEETGATYPMGDVTALADLMVRFAADPTGLIAMGLRAQQLVLTRYTVERAVEGTLAAIKGVVGRRW
jgi:glycosyltransferase involved in cell wall biosynthesis